MKHYILTIFILVLLPVVVFAAAPVVANVEFSQRTDGTMIVDISYDVADTDGDLLEVSIECSDDGGTTWTIPITQVSGDIGSGIAPGVGKAITWDVALEHPDMYGTNFVFRITAEDGSVPIPANFILVEGGTFNNGSSNVTISSFYIDKYEVTQDGYQAVVGSNPASGYGFGANYPVYYVSWFKTIAYCNLRSIQEGLTPCYNYSTYGSNPNDWPIGWDSDYENHTNVSCDWNADGYRLPTEMEWMYAARGGNQSHGYAYSGSTDINTVAWYWSNSTDGTKQVGTKSDNEIGTFDMSGNVWEWCWDIQGTYPSEDQVDPTGATIGNNRVVRGGSWGNTAIYCTVTNRGSGFADVLGNGVGFRVVRPIR